jgi:hypothetical protein
MAPMLLATCCTPLTTNTFFNVKIAAGDIPLQLGLKSFFYEIDPGRKCLDFLVTQKLEDRSNKLKPKATHCCADTASMMLNKGKHSIV